MSKIFVDQVDPKTATTLTLGTTGDTVDIPSGVTLSGAGTITASAANLAASGAGGVTGTLPIANGGTGATTLAAAGLANTPAFQAYNPQNGSVANSTNVVLSFNTEILDSSAAYDTSTYKFTPQVAGYYYCYANVRWQTSTNAATRINVDITKNGTSMASGRNNNTDYSIVHTSGIIQLNGSSDYIQVESYQNTGNTTAISTEDENCFFGAFLLIGA
jgi:hypothetical protein